MDEETKYKVRPLLIDYLIAIDASTRHKSLTIGTNKAADASDKLMDEIDKIYEEKKNVKKTKK